MKLLPREIDFAVDELKPGMLRATLRKSKVLSAVAAMLLLAMILLGGSALAVGGRFPRPWSTFIVLSGIIVCIVAAKGFLALCIEVFRKAELSVDGNEVTITAKWLWREEREVFRLHKRDSICLCTDVSEPLNDTVWRVVLNSRRLNGKRIVLFESDSYDDALREQSIIAKQLRIQMTDSNVP